jgi:hypothetical protein
MPVQTLYIVSEVTYIHIMLKGRQGQVIPRIRITRRTIRHTEPRPGLAGVILGLIDHNAEFFIVKSHRIIDNLAAIIWHFFRTQIPAGIRCGNNPKPGKQTGGKYRNDTEIFKHDNSLVKSRPIQGAGIQQNNLGDDLLFRGLGRGFVLGRGKL